MLKLYPENYDVAVDVLFTDLNGAPVTVTGVDAVLYDGDDEIVASFMNLPFDQVDGKKTITIPAEFNILGEGDLSVVRVLRSTLHTAAGDITRSFGYIVEGESRLELLNNSFTSLEAAEAAARDLPNVKAWLAASDEQRAAALIQAYARVSRIQVRFPLTPEETDTRDFDERQYCVVRPGQWTEIPKDQFLGFPKDFRRALRAAQVCEANVILADNPVTQRHRSGVISETIGESSVMLRGGKLELGVDNETLRCLSGYVYYDVRVARG